jgi:hypothetical protein
MLAIITAGIAHLQQQLQNQGRRSSRNHITTKLRHLLYCHNNLSTIVRSSTCTIGSLLVMRMSEGCSKPTNVNVNHQKFRRTAGIEEDWRNTGLCHLAFVARSTRMQLKSINFLLPLMKVPIL